MSFTAKWKNTNERLAAVAICDMLGVSQGAFTRIAILREIARVSAMGRAAEAAATTGASNELSSQATSNQAVPGEAGSEGPSGDILANETPANGAS